MIRFAVFIILIFLAVLIVAENVGRPIPYGYRILAGLIVAFWHRCRDDQWIEA
jgi:hypothetical protein